MQTANLPTATLSVTVFDTECNDTLHNELVQSVNQTVVDQAPTDVQDNLLVTKGNCTVSALSVQLVGIAAYNCCCANERGERMVAVLMLDVMGVKAVGLLYH